MNHLPLANDSGSVSQALRVDQVCLQFEADWRAGRQPRIEDVLRAAADADRPRLLWELLRLELEYRCRAGEPPAADEYRARLPGMEDVVAAAFRGMVMGQGTTAPPGDTSSPPTPLMQAAPTQPAAPHTTYPPAAGPEGEEPPVIPNYEILGELGRGGMGVVYRARDRNLNRVVALKVIRGGAHAPSAVRARFRTEAEAIARLSHPHIVHVYHSGEQGGQPFLVLEFVRGGSLDKQLVRNCPQPIQDSARLVMLLARAVHAAHREGIVHRDLKPGNVLLAPPADEPALNTPWGCPKVTDFGLARLCDVAGGSVAGAVVGTPEYMAPEQAEGRLQEIGPATDVWALGVILYELLTGRLPFQANSVTALVVQLCLDEPRPMREVRPEVPEALAAVVSRCLRKRPEDRYPSAAALAEDLKRLDGVLVNTPSGPATADLEKPEQSLTQVYPARGKGSPVSLRRWLPWAVGVLACAVLGVGLGMWRGLGPGVPSNGEAPPPPLAINTFRVTHILVDRDGGMSRKRRGPFGEKSYGAWVGDGAQVEVEFSEPVYAYLLVFNPNPQPDKREEAWPESVRDSPPQQTQRLVFPDEAGGHYELSDGPGLTAFAVVASRNPLPAYPDWVVQRGAVGWEQMASIRGVVWTGAGGNLRAMFAPDDPRGEVVVPKESAVLRRLLHRLESAPGVEAVAMVALTVEPRP